MSNVIRESTNDFLIHLANEMQSDLILELNCWPTIRSWDYGIVGYRLSESEYRQCQADIAIWNLKRGKYRIQLFCNGEFIPLKMLKRNRQTIHVWPILIFNSMTPWIVPREISKIKRDMRDSIRYVNELTLKYHRENGWK